jgi:hypothetical protein
MASEILSGSKTGTRNNAEATIIRGSAVSDHIISGTQVISGGTPTRDQEAEPTLIRLEVPHGEGLGVYFAIAWSLALEAGIAALGYAVFQLWKLF